jgi:hypothetical protein
MWLARYHEQFDEAGRKQKFLQTLSDGNIGLQTLAPRLH